MNAVMGVIGLGVPLLQGSAVHKAELVQADGHHDQNLTLAVELARRDILQELKDQKSDKLQTLMVLDTLLVECCFGVIIEGMPPRESWRPLLGAFSLFLALALGCFLTSVWCVMKCQSRMTRHNLLNREHVYMCGKLHPSFQSYFVCHCAELARYSILLFYVGVFCMMATACILLYSRWVLFYEMEYAGILFGVIILALCVIMMGLGQYIKTGAALTDSDVSGHWTTSTAETKQHAMEPLV